MKWITEHVGLVVTLLVGSLGGGAVLRKPIGAVWKAYLTYRKVQATLHETQERLSAGYHEEATLTGQQLQRAKDECDTLKAEIAGLRQALVDAAIERGILKDVNDQDLFTIRLLKARLKDNGIDFHDVEVAVRKQVREKWLSE